MGCTGGGGAQGVCHEGHPGAAVQSEMNHGNWGGMGGEHG